MTWSLTLAGLPRAGAISKSLDYKQNVQKMKGLLKKWVLTGKQFEDFRQKISKIPLLPWRTKQKNHKTPRAKIEHEACSQEEINWSNFEKSIQNKFVWNLQDYNQEVKSWPVQLFVNSPGHDMANDAGRATTCRRNFKTPWLETTYKKWSAFWKNEL